MALRIAICNNRKDSNALRSMLLNSGPLSGVTFETVLFENKAKLVECFRKDAYCFDIVLLDPAIGGPDALQAAHYIRSVNTDCPIILTASTPEFALAGYAIFATGYLVRPFTQEQLDRFLRQAVNLCGHKQSEGLFYIKVKQDFVAVSESELVFAESDLKYMLLHMANGSVLRTMMPMENLISELHGKQFLLSHKSFLVNMDYITAVSPYVFTLGSYGVASITQRRYAKIRNSYFAYLGSSAVVLADEDIGVPELPKNVQVTA